MDYSPDVPFARSIDDVQIESEITSQKCIDITSEVNLFIDAIQTELEKYPQCFELTIYKIPRLDYCADRIAIKLNVPNHADNCSIVFIDIEDRNKKISKNYMEMEIRYHLFIGNNKNIQKDMTWYTMDRMFDAISLIVGIFMYNRYNVFYNDFIDKTQLNTNEVFKSMLVYRKINIMSPGIFPIDKILQLLTIKRDV